MTAGSEPTTSDMFFMEKYFSFCKNYKRRLWYFTNMTSLQLQIVKKFLAKLAETKDVDTKKVEQLKNLLADEKQLKPDDLVKIFSLPLDEPIK